MGAWIEINALLSSRIWIYVAPFMGAWIEICKNSLKPSLLVVAPFMGAWIEILVGMKKAFNPSSRSLYGGVD